MRQAGSQRQTSPSASVIQLDPQIRSVRPIWAVTRHGASRAERESELRERCLYRPHALGDTLFVFDQREAHVAVAARPESHPWGCGDLGLLDQELRELERPHLLVG